MKTSASDTVTITANGEIKEVEARPLTMLFHRGDVALGFPDREVIDPERTISVRTQDVRLDEHIAGANLVQMVLGKGPNRPPLAERHVYGLGVLIYRCLREGRRFALRYPETFLHPAQQLNLADFLVRITQREKRP